MAGASREGPEHPQLYMYADLWNTNKDLTARERIQKEIDAAIARSLTGIA